MLLPSPRIGLPELACLSSLPGVLVLDSGRLSGSAVLPRSSHFLVHVLTQDQRSSVIPYGEAGCPHVPGRRKGFLKAES
ncbi:hypothetical protein CRENBAI_025372 [Crenichthys baileyi]|uniref:Uncharacterized protein n=1 Tax=Crenichthys baileyi TaxID=28760 RepID=A0AAV9RHK7_9TELE